MGYVTTNEINHFLYPKQENNSQYSYSDRTEIPVRMVAESQAVYQATPHPVSSAGNVQAPKITHEEWLKEDLFLRISKSNFRSRFHLSENDREYVRSKGMDTIRKHAQDFIAKRLAPAVIPNDGKQTPMRGHPVFIAQHATGCCCRGCLFKWHGIPAGHELTQQEQEYVINVLMEWIERQMKI